MNITPRQSGYLQDSVFMCVNLLFSMVRIENCIIWERKTFGLYLIMNQVTVRSVALLLMNSTVTLNDIVLEGNLWTKLSIYN